MNWSKFSPQITKWHRDLFTFIPLESRLHFENISVAILNLLMGNPVKTIPSLLLFAMATWFAISFVGRYSFPQKPGWDSVSITPALPRFPFTPTAGYVCPNIVIQVTCLFLASLDEGREVLEAATQLDPFDYFCTKIKQRVLINLHSEPQWNQ